MERIGNKVSYIKKPLAKNSFVAAGLVAAALLFYAAAIGFSYHPGECAACGSSSGFLQYYHCGIIGGLRDLRDDGEGEKLHSGEDLSRGGGDPAARVGTDDRICSVMKWRHETWNKI